MKKIAVFLFFISVLASCASAGNTSVKWVQAGPDFTHSKKKTIEVFTEESQIKREYAYFGKIFTESGNPEKLSKAIEQIAASNGADAVLIHTSIGKITGYAVKYTDNLTEEDNQAIRDFNAVHTIRD